MCAIIVMALVRLHPTGWLAWCLSCREQDGRCCASQCSLN